MDFLYFYCNKYLMIIKKWIPICKFKESLPYYAYLNRCLHIGQRVKVYALLCARYREHHNSDKGTMNVLA